MTQVFINIIIYYFNIQRHYTHMTIEAIEQLTIFSISLSRSSCLYDSQEEKNIYILEEGNTVILCYHSGITFNRQNRELSIKQERTEYLLQHGSKNLYTHQEI